MSIVGIEGRETPGNRVLEGAAYDWRDVHVAFVLVEVNQGLGSVEIEPPGPLEEDCLAYDVVNLWLYSLDELVADGSGHLRTREDRSIGRGGIGSHERRERVGVVLCDLGRHSNP